MSGLDLRLLSPMYVKLAFVVITAVLIECNEAGITEEVIRRPSGDIYMLSGSDFLSVCRDNHYLVSEGRCVTDLLLLNGKLIHCTSLNKNIYL